MINKKIFLTGGAGFIGTKLCEKLINSNEIVIYDCLYRNSIKSTNLLKNSNIKLINGDILDQIKLKKAIDEFRPHIVIHLAAIAGVDSVIRNPVNTLKVNIIGTYNVLEAIKDKNIEKFIDFSTSEVFGSSAYKVEEIHSTNLAPVGEARWTYSVSKLAGEHLTHSYYKEFGIPTVTIRPFNIYGPGQIGEGAIHTFVERAISNQNIEIHGEGDQIRSWCYIDDFVNGVYLSMINDEAIGQTFNIGDPRGTITISMLADLIKRLANSASEIVNIPKDYVDVDLRVPNIDKAKEVLGYKPMVELSKGLEKTIDWYRSLK